MLKKILRDLPEILICGLGKAADKSEILTYIQMILMQVANQIPWVIFHCCKTLFLSNATRTQEPFCALVPQVREEHMVFCLIYNSR